MLGDALPALVVILLQLWCIQRLPGRMDHLARLEHESHGAGEMIGLADVSRARLLETRRIRTVSAHAVVQAGATGREAAGLGVVRALEQAREFAGDGALGIA